MAVLSLLLVLCIIQTFKFGYCIQNSSLYCFKNERSTLIEFKYSLSDPSSRLSSWVGDHCCSWNGVECDSRTGHVVKLDLRNSLNEYLVGKELNPSLIELKQLRYLDLSCNNFSGSRMPSFLGSFRHLRYLNLSYTYLSGKIPHDLGNLSSLHSLDVSMSYESYDLWVDSLHWMSRLHSLQYLSMGRVNLSLASDWQYTINQLPSLLELHLSYCGLAKFSPSFSHFSLTHLTVLNLSGNYFEGEIPNYLHNITSLEVLDLSGNLLVSPIPSWLGDFRSLVHLNLGENQFTGQLGGNTSLDVGVDWLGQLTNLNYLRLADNNFSGHIPKSLGRLSALRELYVNNNNLNGIIPIDIGQLSELRVLVLSSNSLEGFMSEDHFSKLSRLECFDIGGNSLVLNVGSQWVPPFQLKRLGMNSCRLGPNFPKWLQTQLELTRLDMFNTSISTSMPGWFANQISTQMEFLDLSHNQIRGQVPSFLKQIYVDLSFNKFEGHLPHFRSNAAGLDLRNNSISGPLPNDIGDMMPMLRALKLSFNHINGSIPSSICTMKNLTALDLSKNQLSGDLPLCWANLQSLDHINLASNNLSGTIGSAIGHLQSLKSLILSDNNFHGEIPLALRRNTNLYLLDIGENKLSGKIPSWIGEDLRDLKVLRLRSNIFYGNIPLELCQLTHLQIMDLARNNLSGTIPHCFGNITGMVSRKAESLPSVVFGSKEYRDLLVETVKGRENEYENLLELLVNLDISSNKLNGGIPKELTLLSGLIGLNFSNNHLSGSIPTNIGNLSLLESLDLSNNNLSGRIPESISALTALSHLNLSQNILSGPIPSGKQLQTLNDPSMYEGNTGLCGDPLQKCKQEEDDDGGNVKVKDDKDDRELLGFYIGMVFGFIVGFWGLACVYWFNKPWRYAYLRSIDGVIDMLFVAVVVRVNRLKRKLEGNQEVKT